MLLIWIMAKIYFAFVELFKDVQGARENKRSKFRISY